MIFQFRRRQLSSDDVRDPVAFLPYGGEEVFDVLFSGGHATTGLFIGLLPLDPLAHICQADAEASSPRRSPSTVSRKLIQSEPLNVTVSFRRYGIERC
jgi:hypothetical protein